MVYPKLQTGILMKKIEILEPTIFNSSKKLLAYNIKKNQISTSSHLIIKKFENKISNISGSKFALLTNTGSAALYTGFKSLGILKNDLVIMPSYTFIATPNACILSGGSPWFFDIEKDSLTIDLKQVEKKLKTDTFKKGKFYYHKKTKQRVFAICPVYTLGFLPDLVKIKELAETYNLKILADAACAIGSSFNGKKLSFYNDVITYSFNGNKSITSGGGGALCINNRSIYEKANLLISNGKIGQYFHQSFGLNLKITGLHAALGFGQIKELKKITKIKKMIREKYINFFMKNNIKTFYLSKKTSSSIWLNFLIAKKNINKKIFSYAKKSNINLNYFWKPMHLQPFLKLNLKEEMKNTNIIWKKILVLPSSLHLTSKNIIKIKKFLYKNLKFL